MAPAGGPPSPDRPPGPAPDRPRAVRRVPPARSAISATARRSIGPWTFSRFVVGSHPIRGGLGMGTGARTRQGGRRLERDHGSPRSGAREDHGPARIMDRQDHGPRIGAETKTPPFAAGVRKTSNVG